MNINLPKLLWILDNVPLQHRKWNNDIIAYHVTYIDNVERIKEHGIKAKSSYQGYERKSAVYFFLDHSVIPDNIAILLGDVKDYAIITFTIPSREIVNMAFDGLYNASFTVAYSASMYYGDIPFRWIGNIEICHIGDYKE